MKMSTYELLCCPVCKGDLKLTVTEKRQLENGEEDVLEGSLFCEKCNADYKISEGIPDLLPKNLE